MTLQSFISHSYLHSHLGSVKRQCWIWLFNLDVVLSEKHKKDQSAYHPYNIVVLIEVISKLTMFEIGSYIAGNRKTGQLLLIWKTILSMIWRPGMHMQPWQKVKSPGSFNQIPMNIFIVKDIKNYMSEKWTTNFCSWKNQTLQTL